MILLDTGGGFYHYLTNCRATFTLVLSLSIIFYRRQFPSYLSRRRSWSKIFGTLMPHLYPPLTYWLWFLLDLDKFHIKSSATYTQDHVWSTFLMVCVVAVVYIPILNITSILKIQLHSRDYCKCNCPLFLNSNIWYSYSLQDFVAIFEVLHKKPNPVLFIKGARSSTYLVLGTCVNSVHTGNIRRNFRTY